MIYPKNIRIILFEGQKPMHDLLLNLFSIQRLCVHDGPGIRTTIFLKGCYLQCPWCCNPEGISLNDEYLFAKDKCLYENNIKSSLCNNCEIVGGSKHLSLCQFGASKCVKKQYKEKELLDILLLDKSLFDQSGGGVTISGGEPFLQAESLAIVLKLLKNNSIHIAIETSAYFPHSSFFFIEKMIDLYIVDLKLQLGFIRNREIGVDYTDDFYLNMTSIRKSGAAVLYRLVYIPEYMDDLDRRNDLVKKMKELHVDKIQLLPYHNLALNKYDQLGKKNKSYLLPTEEKLVTFKYFLSLHKIECDILHL